MSHNGDFISRKASSAVEMIGSSKFSTTLGTPHIAQQALTEHNPHQDIKDRSCHWTGKPGIFDSCD
jgi:hypothetical protein